MTSKDELRQLAVDLYDVGVVKYGDFSTPTGLRTPIYIDLRDTISYPKLLVRLSKQLWSLSDSNSKHKRICGVPYGAIPIATIISADANIPMIVRHKNTNNKKNSIEGIFNCGDSVVLVEDVIGTGKSVLETVKDLEDQGLKVNVVLAIIDVEIGGLINLADSGVKSQSLFTLTDLFEYLNEGGRLSNEDMKIIRNYCDNVKPTYTLTNKRVRLTQDFGSRVKSAKNPIAAKLLNLMAEKRSTICLAADYTNTKQILVLANMAGPHIVVLKIHVDIVKDFNKDFVINLKLLSKKHNFLIMEDRKFADIGHVVSQQFSRGVHHICDWADLVTAHAIAGPGIIDGLRSALDGVNEPKGVFLLAEMSSKGSLTSSDYANAVVDIGKDNDLVAGYVCQNNVFDDLGQVQITPGDKLVECSDDFGQQYKTPAQVVKSGADLVIVGKGITEATDKLQAVLEYKRAFFKAYQMRISE